MAERLRKIRGQADGGVSPLRVLSRGGRGDSGESRASDQPKPGDQPQSCDQSGLVTLEWIILVAAITGIVTMALLVGWDALWDRGDELADEGGSGHQLSARRAAAETTSGRACSLLNDLYDDTFKWIADPDDPTDINDCTCEINSDATKAQVCHPEEVVPFDITIGLKKDGNPEIIEASTLLFSQNHLDNPNDVTYTLLSPLPATNIVSTNIDSNSGKIYFAVLDFLLSK